MKKLIMIIVAAALVALPAMAQSFSTQQVVQPNAAFQSTSSMMGSGSAYSATPMLGEDGTASAPGCGPRRAKMEDPDPFGGQTIGETTNPTEPGTPLGDAVLPLLLMSLAFCGVLYMRKRKAQA